MEEKDKNNETAWMGEVIQILPIEKADFLELAVADIGMGGVWSGVVKKGEFSSGDLCNVFLQDALIPKDMPGMEFMEKSRWRVRMSRFRGAPSESLITKPFIIEKIGSPIGNLLGIEKYEKPISPQLSGEVRGNFPSFIPKTDEDNFQKVPEFLEYLATVPVYITTKYDGSSGTIYRYRGDFGVCSRNMDLKETEGNSFWKVAKEWDLENTLPDGYAVQFELYGEGIQKNPLKVKGVHGAVFNVFNINNQEYLSFNDMMKFAFGLPMVEILEYDFMLESTDAEYLRNLAEGKYFSGKQREGIVIRPMIEHRIGNSRVSTKIINLLYKD